MYIDLSFWHQLVYTGCILGPVDVEIFPESGSTQVEHRTPIFADDIHSALVIACLGHGFEHVVTIERREALCASYTQHILVGFLGLHESGQCHEGCPLLGLVMVGNVFLQLLRSLGTSVCQFLVAHRQCHFMTGIHGHNHKGLQSGIHALHIRRRRPVEESGSVQHFLAILIDFGHQMVEQGSHVFLLFLQVIQVALIEIPVLVNEQPPNGIGTDAIHPVRYRSGIANQIQALRNHFIVSEHGIHGHEFGMQIAYPYQTVTLHPVPNVFLHIEMNGIGSRHPNIIQALVIALERAQVRDIPIAERSTDFLQAQFCIRLFQIDADETETRITDFCHTQPRQGQIEIADSMVVGRSILRSNIAHRF